MAGDDQGYWAEELARIERLDRGDEAARHQAAREQRQFAARAAGGAVPARHPRPHGKERAQQQTKQTRRVRAAGRVAARRTADPGDGPRIPRQAPATARPAAAARPRHRRRRGGPLDRRGRPGGRRHADRRPARSRRRHRRRPGPTRGRAQPEASSRECRTSSSASARCCSASPRWSSPPSPTERGRAALAHPAHRRPRSDARPPPVVARRGLISTAETIAAVGLALRAPQRLRALHRRGGPRRAGAPAPVFAGVVFAVTAAVAAGYAGLTGLSVPRYATVLAAPAGAAAAASTTGSPARPAGRWP